VKAEGNESQARRRLRATSRAPQRSLERKGVCVREEQNPHRVGFEAMGQARWTTFILGLVVGGFILGPLLAPLSTPTLTPEVRPLTVKQGGVGGKSLARETLNTISRMLRNHSCEYVYLDLGSNIGVQPRKLYEPRCYPMAENRSMFKQVFPKEALANRSVCTFGFEPNLNHVSRLQRVEKRLVSLGAPVRLFIQAAVGGHEKENVTFYTDNNKRKHEWGATIEKGGVGMGGKFARVGSGYRVHVVSLPSILRAFKDYGKIRTLLIKLDIEGSEYDAASQALLSGVLCSGAKSTHVVMEEHPWILRGPKPPTHFFQSLAWMASRTEGCTPQITARDDETYLHDTFTAGCIV